MSSRRRYRGALVGACLGLWAAGVSNVAWADPSPPVITHPEGIQPWLYAAVTARADVVCLGDSNQLQQGHGWDHGWIKALDQRFGLYASGLISAGENSGNGSGAGYEYSLASTASSGLFHYAGAPQPLDILLAPGSGVVPLNYFFLPEKRSGGATAVHGLFIDHYSGLDVNGPLRFHLVHALFPPGPSGQFKLHCQQAVPPYQTYAVGPLQSTASHTGYGVATTTLTLPVGTRESALNFRFTPVGQDLIGPFLAYYVRCENTARPVGVSLHTLYAQGGRSARDMAAALLAADSAQLTLYFQSIRALQGPNPRILIRVNTGVNDRNEYAPSVLNQITPGNTPEAFADNLRAIVARIGIIWLLNNWPAEELYFLFTLSHPVAIPDDPLLLEFRAAAAELAAASPRCSAIDLGMLTAWGEMVANGWYQYGGFDTNHLTQPGYEALAEREVAALEGGACWRDLNGDRRLDAEDLYEWHRVRPDLDADGSAGYADLRCLEAAVRAAEPNDQASTRTPALVLP